MASYHAISFGATETAGVVWGSDYPYLQSVPSPGDKLSPDYETVVSFKAADFSAALCKEVKDLKLEGDAAGWVTGDPKLLRGRHRGGNHRGRHEDHRPTDAGGTLPALGLLHRQIRGRRVSVHRPRLRPRGGHEPVRRRLHGAAGIHLQEILTHYYTGVTIE